VDNPCPLDFTLSPSLDSDRTIFLFPGLITKLHLLNVLFAGLEISTLKMKAAVSSETLVSISIIRTAHNPGSTYKKYDFPLIILPVSYLKYFSHFPFDFYLQRGKGENYIKYKYQVTDLNE